MLLSIVVSNRLDPYWNLAVENFLMQDSDPDVMTFYLWRNQRTVVVGRNQNPYSECRVEQLLADGGFLLRRTTGGGAVYHDGGNLNFSFVVPVADYDLSRQFSVIQHAVDDFGLHTERSGRNDLLVECLDSSESVSVPVLSTTSQTQYKKFSGNAFAKGRSHHLHHGTLLIAGDMGDLQRYLVPSTTKMAKHGVSSVQSRVVNLSRLADVTVENIQPRLIAACEQVYGLRSEWVDFDVLCDDHRVRDLHDLYCSDAWLTAGWKDFSTTMSSHFSWGEIALSLQVVGGKIVGVRIATDALDVESVERLRQLLLHSDINHCPNLPSDIDAVMGSDVLSLLYRNK